MERKKSIEIAAKKHANIVISQASYDDLGCCTLLEVVGVEAAVESLVGLALSQSEIYAVECAFYKHVDEIVPRMLCTGIGDGVLPEEAISAPDPLRYLLTKGPGHWNYILNYDYEPCRDWLMRYAARLRSGVNISIWRMHYGFLTRETWIGIET